MSNNVYTWRHRDHPILKGGSNADAQSVGEAIERINPDMRKVSPRDVVDAAKDDPVLRPFFHWNNDVAGENWRLTQARALLRSLAVERIIDHTTVQAPAFLSIAEKGEKQSYRPFTAIEESLALQRRLLEQASRDLKAYRNRYSTLTYICSLLEPVLDAIDRELAGSSAPVE